MNDQRDDAASVAREAFGRFWDATMGEAVGGDARHGDGSRHEIRAALARLVDLQMDIVQRLFGAQVDFLAERLNPRRTSVDPADRIELKVEVGSEVAAVVWLHNITATSLGNAAFVAGTLTSAAGDAMVAEVVRFDPPRVQGVEVDAVVSTSIVVAVPVGTPVGAYHGFVFVAGRPDVAGHLVVTVTSGHGSDHH